MGNKKLKNEIQGFLTFAEMRATGLVVSMRRNDAGSAIELVLREAGARRAFSAPIRSGRLQK